MGRKHKFYDLATIIRLRNCGLLDCFDGFNPKDEVDSTARMLTGHQHALVTGQAANLIENIINRGGSKEDLTDSIKYSLCCLDAKKYGLDLDDAQKKFRYHELCDKYSE